MACTAITHCRLWLVEVQHEVCSPFNCSITTASNVLACMERQVPTEGAMHPCSPSKLVLGAGTLNT